MNPFATYMKDIESMGQLSLVALTIIISVPSPKCLLAYTRAERKLKKEETNEEKWKEKLDKEFINDTVPWYPTLPFLQQKGKRKFLNVRTWMKNLIEKLNLIENLENYKLLQEQSDIMLKQRLYKFELLKQAHSLSISLGSTVSFVEFARFFKNRVEVAQRTTRTKIREGKDKAVCTCDLSVESLILKYIQQNGRCFISNIILNFIGKDFLLSVERISNNLGETNDNTVLICREMNIGNHMQWTRDLLRQCIELKNTVITSNDIEMLCVELNQPSSESHQWVVTRLSGTRDRTTNWKRDLMCDVPNDLDLSWYIEQVRKQRGCCFISGIPLIFEKDAIFRSSIERLNEDLYYTKSNCVLIILPLNNFGGQWNLEKYEKVCTSFIERDSINIITYPIPMLEDIIIDVSQFDTVFFTYDEPLPKSQGVTITHNNSLPIDNEQMCLSLPGEIWTEIPSFSNYQVSNFGRIYKKNRMSVLQTQNKISWNLDHDDKEDPVKYDINQLVMDSFAPIESPEQIQYKIVHINNDKYNKRLDNLRREEKSEDEKKITPFVYKYSLYGEIITKYESKKIAVENNATNIKTINRKIRLFTVVKKSFVFTNREYTRAEFAKKLREHGKPDTVEFDIIENEPIKKVTINAFPINFYPIACQMLYNDVFQRVLMHEKVQAAITAVMRELYNEDNNIIDEIKEKVHNTPTEEVKEERKIKTKDKPIWRYNKDGECSNEYKNAEEASVHTGIRPKEIYKKILNFTLVQDSFVLTHKPYTTEEILKILRNKNPGIPKIISQCNLDGSVEKQYSSLNEASRESKVGSKMIMRCCNGSIDSVENYIWKADERPKFKLEDLEPLPPDRALRIEGTYYSVNGEFCLWERGLRSRICKHYFHTHKCKQCCNAAKT